MTGRHRFIELFKRRAVQFGDFTLASGRKSTYYMDSKLVLFHPESLNLLGYLLAQSVQDLVFDAIGGPEVGAIPMAAAVLPLLYRAERNIEGFFVRKEAKSHGRQLLIEGTLKEGDRVAMLEDVVTTGGSVIKAIQAVESVGAKVVRIVSICDRLEGGQAALAAYDYRPLFTINDLGIGFDPTVL